MMRFLILAGLLLVAPKASASTLNLGNDIQNVSNGLMPTFGAGGSGAGMLNNMLLFLGERILMMAGIVATFIIVKAGLSLINSQADDKLSKARREIGTAVVAIILGYLSQRFVAATYGIGGTAIFNPVQSVGILHLEAAGLISYGLELMVILSIIMIIYTSLKVVSSFGKEDSRPEIRKAIFGVAFGLLLLTSASAIQLSLGINPNGVTTNPGPIVAGPIISRVIHILQVFLGLAAIVSVAFIVYAAVNMMLSNGKEDTVSEMRKLIVRVMIGLFIILMSYVFTQFVLQMLTF